MRFERRLRTRPAWALVAAGTLWLLGLPALAGAAADSPAAVVESLHAGLTEVASESLDLEQRYERLLPLIERTHDLPYIAELTIRRQWRDLSETDRRRFVTAFERLSVMTYASRFAGVAPGAFEEYGLADPGSARRSCVPTARRSRSTIYCTRRPRVGVSSTFSPTKSATSR